MVTKTLNGYTIESTAIRSEIGANAFDPAVLRKQGKSSEPTILVLPHLMVERLSEEEAHQRSAAYVDSVIAITNDGKLWDRQPSD